MKLMNDFYIHECHDLFYTSIFNCFEFIFLYCDCFIIKSKSFQFNLQFILKKEMSRLIAFIVK